MNVKLGGLINRGVRELFYTYDMGDWHHHITVETTGPVEAEKQVPALDRRRPPLQSGRRRRHARLRQLPRRHRRPHHEEHAEILQWLRRPYDPETFDELITKRRVAAIAIRRAAGKGAYAKR